VVRGITKSVRIATTSSQSSQEVCNSESEEPALVLIEGTEYNQKKKPSSEEETPEGT
jgi:hypothetical protein